MSSPSTSLPRGFSAALTELCEELGVQSTWEAGGGVCRAPVETVLAALRALGAPLDGPDGAADALRAVREERRTRIVPPTTVSWLDEEPAVAVNLPARVGFAPLELDFVLEDGSRGRRVVDPGDMGGAVAPDLAEGEGGRRALLPLPAGLPPGYHEVRLRLGDREAHTLVVRAPRTTWRPPDEADGEPSRRWGSFLPLHALRTERSRGVGDLADLRALAGWTADLGGAWVGTLPLYDTFMGEDGPFDPSPYAPVSRLFWNPLWIALDEAPGLERPPEARALLEDADLAALLGRLGEADRVDYRQAMTLKRRVLEALARAHGGDGPHGLGPELTRWIQEDPEALAYARFRAAVEATGQPWTRWHAPARDGDADALDPPDDAVCYHVYAQWAVERQLDELSRTGGAGLYLDLPLGAHAHGFDHWRHPGLFVDGFTVGAPPDAFFEGGQDWGFPPLHPRRTGEEGHGYVAAGLQRAMAVSAALRLDHVMALHRLYWVPEDATAAEGVYVRYPRDELWAVLCLESHRSRTEVVGEDLGTVPAEVPLAMERHRVRRMWVLPFEVAAGGPTEPYRLNPPSPGCVASLDTHDLPPFAAFLTGADIDARLAAGRLDTAAAEAERAGRADWRKALVELLRDRDLLPWEGTPDGRVDEAAVLEATLRFLGSSPAGVLLVNLEDLWLETAQQNLPGTPTSENWARKARLSLEEMASDPRVLQLLRLVQRCR